MRTLTIDDILDLRAYEKVRAQLRQEVIDLKRLRRVALGSMISVVFENKTTMRFQVQEMARAERMMRDEDIQAELDVYNELIPAKNELVATLFVELTSKAELEEWLPKLAGVERSLQLVMGTVVVPATLEASHEEQLTRSDVTASVHYLRFALPEAVASTFVDHEAHLVVHHAAYQADAELGGELKRSLAADWQMG
ncbi:MAG: DUF3501 family protein [Ferrimicrobium sp.]|jgi:hypothetical protein|uniref:DUF3501 family protein n=1 Tax=Ferrimicrobium acidiphilum TaxID=121039 RepID=A0ABV3XZS2_9ACTN|nr:DUF3501 family protein [Ferrimicrobium sp.]